MITSDCVIGKYAVLNKRRYIFHSVFDEDIVLLTHMTEAAD